jgi:hypothetical protein
MKVSEKRRTNLPISLAADVFGGNAQASSTNGGIAKMDYAPG